MYETDGRNICVPKGDSARIAFTFLGEDGETPYLFDIGQYAVFDVRKTPDSGPEITKTVTAAEQDSDGTAVFALTSEDTDITRHGYIYTVRLMNAGSTEADTVCGAPARAFFTIV